MSWRFLTSETRITQDVMKTLIIAYVEELPSVDIRRDSFEYLNNLEVRPVAVTNRHTHSLNEQHRTLRELQQSYGSHAILKRPRKSSKGKRKAKERVSMEDERPKKQSKNNKIWKVLMKPIQGSQDDHEANEAEEVKPVETRKEAKKASQTSQRRELIIAQAMAAVAAANEELAQRRKQEAPPQEPET